MEKEFSNGSITYLWLICLVAAGGGLLFGYDVVVVSGIIPQVVKQFGLTSFQLGFLVSCVLWGCAIGSGFGGIILDAFGRKKVMDEGKHMPLHLLFKGIGLLFVSIMSCVVMSCLKQEVSCSGVSPMPKNMPVLFMMDSVCIPLLQGKF